VCDNFITHNIPGTHNAVRKAAQEYRAWFANDTGVTKFDGRWKWEFHKVLGKAHLPVCRDLKVFGTTYDEMKYFCSPPAVLDNCNVYSLGSNNKWEFEEDMFKATNCNISTFDCTCEGVIPQSIESRTKFYHKCVGTSGDFIPLDKLGNITGVTKVDFLKIDIEGYEWPILNEMAKSWLKNPNEVDSKLPLQMFIELHLDRSPEKVNYVSVELRKFFDRMFQMGYMIMIERPTLQTRNHDVLLVKVLCHDAEKFRNFNP
jgi:hypothetical protein